MSPPRKIVPSFRTNPIQPYKAPIERTPLQNPIVIPSGPVPI
jgi:hypothetical protein